MKQFKLAAKEGRKRSSRTIVLRNSAVVDVEALKKAAVSIEDLLIFFKQVKIEPISLAAETLQSLLTTTNEGAEASAVAKTYQSADPNKHFLIGALPRLLLDRDLFPSNDDIVEFATSALRLDMKVEKRARFEIIGKIVCETDALDEKQLTDLVRAIERIVGDRSKIASMVERKRAGAFSWNETIQELLKQ